LPEIALTQAILYKHYNIHTSVSACMLMSWHVLCLQQICLLNDWCKINAKYPIFAAMSQYPSPVFWQTTRRLRLGRRLVRTAL